MGGEGRGERREGGEEGGSAHEGEGKDGEWPPGGRRERQRRKHPPLFLRNQGRDNAIENKDEPSVRHTNPLSLTPPPFPRDAATSPLPHAEPCVVTSPSTTSCAKKSGWLLGKSGKMLLSAAMDEQSSCLSRRQKMMFVSSRPAWERRRRRRRLPSLSVGRSSLLKRGDDTQRRKSQQPTPFFPFYDDFSFAFDAKEGRWLRCCRGDKRRSAFLSPLRILKSV